MSYNQKNIKLNKINKKKINNSNKYNKYIKSKIIQKGGVDIISASGDVINSMVDLGKSIFTEIHSIVNIQSDINNVSQQTAIPTTQGPPQFNQPKL